VLLAPRAIPLAQRSAFILNPLIALASLKKLGGGWSGSKGYYATTKFTAETRRNC